MFGKPHDLAPNMLLDKLFSYDNHDLHFVLFLKLATQTMHYVPCCSLTTTHKRVKIFLSTTVYMHSTLLWNHHTCIFLSTKKLESIDTGPKNPQNYLFIFTLHYAHHVYAWTQLWTQIGTNRYSPFTYYLTHAITKLEWWPSWWWFL